MVPCRLDGSNPARHQCVRFLTERMDRAQCLNVLSFHLTATILLLLQIGPSALVGIALFIFLTPVQTRIMGMQFQVRKRSMRFTDSRSRLLQVLLTIVHKEASRANMICCLQELLGSFAIVKYFTLERPFLERIGGIRWSELQGIRSILLIKAANQSIAMSLPTLAAVVSFLCYAGIGNDLNPAAVFTALSLFQLLRQPLMFLPRALSAIADAQNALERLTVVFEAETLAVTTNVDPTLDVGIRVSNASFQWMAPPPEENVLTKSSRKTRKVDKNQAASPIPIDEKTLVEVAEPFRIQGLNLEVKRGAITVLAGRVGSGKSSILQGLIGDMRKTSPEGKVHVLRLFCCSPASLTDFLARLWNFSEFGGRVAYCSQTAFIQNVRSRGFLPTRHYQHLPWRPS